MLKKKKSIEVASFSVPKTLIKKIDALTARMGYSSRSEIIRDALRSFIYEKKELAKAEGFLEGVVSVYHTPEADHSLSIIKHQNPDMIKSYMHSHFEHSDICLDILLLSGEAHKIRKLLYELESIDGVELVRLIQTP